MKLFKKKEEKSCCGGNYDALAMKKALEKHEVGARIKILGSGCQKCITLENNTNDALKKMGKLEKIEHITDFTDIASYGVMSTPALVVDGKVISFGKVLNVEEIISLLNKAGI